MSEEEPPRNVLRLKLHIIKSKHKIARIFQITARIIAGIGTLASIAFLGFFFALFLLYGSYISMIFIFLVFISAWIYTTSLKDEFLGGILLIGEAVGFTLYLVLFVKWISGWDLFVTLMITIPLVVSGILFLIAWYLEKYYSKKDMEPKVPESQ